MKREASVMLSVLLVAAMFVIPPDSILHAQTFATLYTFTGGRTAATRGVD